MSEENKKIQDEESEENQKIKESLSEEENSATIEHNEEGEVEEVLGAEDSATDSIEEIGSVAESEQKSEVLSAQHKPPQKRKKKKKSKGVSIGAYLLSTVAVIIAAVLLTFSICSEVFKSKYANNLIITETETKTPTGIDLIEQYIDAYAYSEVDKNAMAAAAFKAYVLATGDPYAYYYTFEELLQNQEDSASRMCGIGVNVAYEVIQLDGQSVATIHIFNVMTGSPALEAGVQAGDLIVNVKTDDGVKTVTELGYDGTLDEFLGEEGTKVEFGVLRKNTEGGYEEKQFSIERKRIESESVYIEPIEGISNIGLIKLLEFNYKTPEQFEKRMDQLIADGCEKFIIDLRGNPGGYEISIAAVLSFFLDEGDFYIQTEDAEGKVTKKAIAPANYGTGDLQGCNIDANDIGKYKGLDFIVLCDKNTASASELFIANFRDYGLGTVVGATTHGKGCMQTTYMLNSGFAGAVKITTHMYYSGKDTELVGYNNVGIVPDEQVAIDSKFAEINIHIVPQEEDAQLQKAIELFSK